MDKIIIQELELQMHIGCSTEERQLQQRIVVSAEIEIDASISAYSLNLNDTVCYLSASKLIEEVAQSKQWVLLEEFSEVICEQMFKAFAQAQSITCEVRKFIVPGVRFTGLAIQRQRGKYA